MLVERGMFQHTRTHARTHASTHTHTHTEYRCDYYWNRSLWVLANRWKKGILINEWRCNPLSFWCAMCQSEQVVCLSLCVCLPADFTTPPSLPLNIPNIFYLPYSLPGRLSPSLSLSSTISLITVSLHPSSSILSSTNPFHPASRNSVRSWVFAHSTRRVKLLVQSNLVLSVGNTCHVSLSINTDNA